MKQVPTEFKDKTIAIDFDGVIHLYSKGFTNLSDAYDPPTPGTRDALKQLKAEGYRLIIVSSRPVSPIKEWLEKHRMAHYFDDISNTKHPARYYIDDHAIRFPRGHDSAWKKTVNLIHILEAERKEKNDK